MDKPKPYRGKTPRAVPMDTIIDVVKDIVAAGKEADFRKACAANTHRMLAQPALVNTVKTFIHENRLHEVSDTSAKVMNSRPGDDTCFPTA